MKKGKRKLAYIVIAFILLSVILAAVRMESKEKQEKVTVKIGIIKNHYIQDANTNYFTKWLEEKSGIDIEFIVFPENYTAKYLDIMFKSGESMVDGFFSFPGGTEDYQTNSVLEEYADKGYLLPLNKYIKSSDTMKQLFSSFSAYPLKEAITSEDGNMYYMPGLDISYSQEYSQILWMNQDWLKKLGLTMPETREELEAVLKAFLTEDPNGNGKKDEIPLAGSCDTYALQSYQFILNSFLYSDPYNSYMEAENGRISFGPSSTEWRKALVYLNGLYKKGLLSPLQFTLNQEQLVQLVNDERDLVGAFTSARMSDVVLQNSPEIISKYVCIKPITGENGIRYAAVKTPLPKAGGVIMADSKYPSEVFHIYELMMTREGFLTGRYGENGVDWEYAKTGDIDINGNPAVISTINNLRNKPQNKTLLETGPFLTYKDSSDGVTWNGYEADQEYINARAYNIYWNYRPKEYIRFILPRKDWKDFIKLRTAIDAYTNKMLAAFIQGTEDPSDDKAWSRYLKHFDDLQINTYIRTVEASYQNMR